MLQLSDFGVARYEEGPGSTATRVLGTRGETAGPNLPLACNPIGSSHFFKTYISTAKFDPQVRTPGKATLSYRPPVGISTGFSKSTIWMVSRSIQAPCIGRTALNCMVRFSLRVPSASHFSSISSPPSTGYVAPEYAQSGQVSPAAKFCI